MNRRTLIEENIVKPVGLVVYKDYVYWIDKDTRKVEKVKKYNDSSRELVQNYVDDLSDIAVVDISTSTGKRDTVKITVEQFKTFWLLAHHRQVAEITTHHGQVTKLTDPSRPGHLALAPDNCVLIAVKKAVHRS